MEHRLAVDPGVAFLSAGKDIWGLSYSAISKKLFACSQTPDRIVVFYVQPLPNSQGFRYGRLPDVTGIADDPYFITCSPTKAKAYACIWDDSSSPSFMAIDTTAGTATPATYIPSPGAPGNMAFSPDGRMSYFPAGNTLYAVDETSSTPSATPIPLTVSANWIAITKDGAFAYCGGYPGDDRAVDIARVDLAAQKQKDLVKNLADSVNTFDVTFDNSELLVSTDAQNIDVVTISQNTKTNSINFGGSMLGQISCSKTAPRACVTTDALPNFQTDGKVFAAVIDTINNNIRGGIPMPSIGACTAFDEYGNAYVGTADNGIMAILYSKINAM